MVQFSGLALRASSVASTSGRHPAPMHFGSGFARGLAWTARGRNSWHLGSPCRAASPEAAELQQETLARLLVGRPSAAGGAPSSVPNGTDLTLGAVRGEQQQATEQQQQRSMAAAAAREQVPNASAEEQGADDLPNQEKERRAKISAANKGRTPWNKGRKHSPEILAKIRERTRAAMQRPEVKAKLAVANQFRPGHSAEAKAKIRAKLRAKVEVERTVIMDQVLSIIASMQQSEDPREQAAAAHPKAARVISGMAWQHFKKKENYEQLTVYWAEPGSAFREASLAKLEKLSSKQQTSRARPRASKVKQALELMRKLEESRVKLKQADAMAAKFAQALPALAGDAREPAVAAAAARAQEVADKIREQVDKMSAALEPLLPYLQPSAEGAASETGAAANDSPARVPAATTARA